MNIEQSLAEDIESVDTDKDSQSPVSDISDPLNSFQRGSNEAYTQWKKIKLGANFTEDRIFYIKAPSDDFSHHDVTSSICHLNAI